MKLILYITGLCFMLIISSSVLLADENSSKNDESSVEIVRIGSSADGIGIIMGVYSPFHKEMEGIYGKSFILNVQHSLNMSPTIDIISSIGYMRKEGNPYYDDPSFVSGNRSKISIIPMEISIRKKYSLMKSPPRGLFIGTGINYIRASEKIPDVISTSGGNFGTHLFIGPQIFLRDGLAFEGEIKLLMNEVDMKSGNIRYPITLSGLSIKAGIMWYY